MPKYLPYASPTEAATMTTEIIGRWRAGTLSDDVRLLFAQVHGIQGFGFSLAPGTPDGDPAPIVPIGMDSAEETCTLGEAERRLQMVMQAGGVPSMGSMSWLTVAIRVALTMALNDLPEPYRSQVLAIIDKVF